MSSISSHKLPMLRRCQHCRAWQHDRYELCLFCGRDFTLGRLATAVRVAPYVFLLLIGGSSALIGSLFVGESTFTWMAALTAFVCAATAAVTIAPRDVFKERKIERHRPELALQSVRRELKDALKMANREGDPAHVTPQLTLLLWGTTFLREGNRSAPLLYGRSLARDPTRSASDTVKKTIQRLNELDREWSSHRLTNRPEAREHVDGLTALLKGVKARPRTWLERLREFGVGDPSPFIDIESRLKVLQTAGRELEARARAAAAEAEPAQDA